MKFADSAKPVRELRAPPASHRSAAAASPGPKIPVQTARHDTGGADRTTGGEIIGYGGGKSGIIS